MRYFFVVSGGKTTKFECILSQFIDQMTELIYQETK